jgi:hypothetical protein
MLKHLFKFGKVKPLIHNGKIISIKLYVVIEGVTSTIIFKDSFLLLSKSLRDLCTAFNLVESKGNFPFNLDNVNYSGVFPKYEHWTDITLKEWNDLKTGYGKRMWNFQLEATKYCKLDCVTLHQILKIIILSAVLETNKEHNLHSNILIENDSTFEDYYEEISNDLDTYNNLEYGYHNENIIRFVVKVWNCDNKSNLNIKMTHDATSVGTLFNKYRKNIGIYELHKRQYSTSSNNKDWNIGEIKPLSLFKKNGDLKLESPKPIFTMDLETINFNDTQIPVAISSCGQGTHKIFVIDHILLQNDVDKALDSLWSQYFKYLETLIPSHLPYGKITIFAHNLGDFDGYFLYKALMLYYNPKNISSIMDDTNTFISITNLISNKIVFEWKDSLRIFPIKLNNLCEVFKVKGKLSAYNPKFNNIDFFKVPILVHTFKKYSLQDAIALYEALIKAQTMYFNLFGVDIESIYSTATLSLKIFRTKFQDKPIYILPKSMDSFIRVGYYGGGTDVYKAHGKNIHYYDVNSLYPYAMLNPMPYDLITPNLIDLSNRTLESFFGFAEVRIYCPNTVFRPVLPFHFEGKTVYPRGTWRGVYFSEELKAVEKLGYQITLIRGYEFTKADLFSDFVNTFYEVKRTSTGAEKMIAKLLLNNLYGYFGRKPMGYKGVR